MGAVQKIESSNSLFRKVRGKWNESVEAAKEATATSTAEVVERKTLHPQNNG
jgi:hypothetical protein